MMETAVISVCQEALIAVLAVSAPATVVALLVGVIISVVQSATQINDQSVSYVPKLLAVSLVLCAAGGWMLGQLVRFAERLFELIPVIGSNP
jgi:flagellar biosynthetic protein FliQ